MSEYFLGRDKYDNYNSTYGWAGHTKDSNTVEKVLTKVGGYQIEKFIEHVSIWDTKEHIFIYIPLKYLRIGMVNYPNYYRSLDLSEVLELNGRRCNQLMVIIRKLGDYTLAVHFKGKSLNTGRNIKEHDLLSTGDAIVLKEENVSRTYMVEITQRQFVEEDPFNECQEYPNPEYASYDECDNQFMRASIPGLTPVWITDDPAEVTIQKDDKNGTYCKFPINFFLPGFDPM